MNPEQSGFCFTLVASFILVALSVTSCGPTTPPTSTPEEVVDQYFAACAGADSARVLELSPAAEFPLVTEWTIRRATETSQYSRWTIPQLLDSLAAETQQNRRAVEDRLTQLYQRTADQSEVIRALQQKVRTKQLELDAADYELKNSRTGLKDKVIRRTELQRQVWELESDLADARASYRPTDDPAFGLAEEDYKEALIAEHRINTAIDALCLSAGENLRATQGSGQILESSVIVDIRGSGLVSQKVRVLVLAIDLPRGPGEWKIVEIIPL